MSFKIIINTMFKFSAFFVIISIVGLVFIYRTISKKNKDDRMDTNKTRIFGLLMELDHLSTLAVSTIYVRFLFLLYTLIFRTELSMLHFYVLILLSFLYGVFSKSIKNIFFDFIGSGAIYIGLYATMLLTNYLSEVRFTWYVFVGNIMLIIFLAMYVFYFFLRNINDVVSKGKYVRRYRNE